MYSIMAAYPQYIPSYQQHPSHGFVQPQQAGAQPKQLSFQPYTDNGGTCAGIAGDDYCVIATDTRMSQGYSIMTRYSNKAVKLTDNCVVASAGMQAERTTLHKVLKAKLTQYEHQHRKQMSTPAIAQMLANTLYYKRFFPYYTFNICGGLDKNGRGVLWSYDAVGSVGACRYDCDGSGKSILQPLLDNQAGFKNQSQEEKQPKPSAIPQNPPEVPPISLETAKNLLKDGFTACVERDIFTGDSLDIFTITKDGVAYENVPLKRD